MDDIDGLYRQDPVFALESVANWFDWTLVKTITFAKDSKTNEVFALITAEDGFVNKIDFVDRDSERARA